MGKRSVISVKMEKLDEALSDLQTAKAEYEEALAKLESTIDAMKPYWTGDASVAFFDRVEVMKKLIKKNIDSVESSIEAANKHKELLVEVEKTFPMIDWWGVHR